jgi:hypothetical protein
VRGGDVLAAVEADVGVTHVVADDDEDVGAFGRHRGDGEQAEHGAKYYVFHTKGGGQRMGDCAVEGVLLVEKPQSTQRRFMGCECPL